MLKTCFLFILISLPVLLFGQANNLIQLTKSESATVEVKKGLTRVKKPVFLHQGAIMTCDSAHYWREKNYFQAFGNVNINQDTVNISSDFLNYDGNSKEAHLIKNVRMSDPSSLLTTNTFFYNTATRIGRYPTTGKITNKEATITSTRGYYFASSNDAYFRENVVVVSNQVTVKSDTLRYNTNTNETYFYGPTDILGKTDTLYTENGQYNTKTQKFFAGKNNLYTQNTKTLRGDSLYYDGIKGYGKAVKNIVFTDSQDQLELHGQLGEYFKETEKVRVQNQAFVALATQDTITVDGKKVLDTLWLGAKILEAEMMLQSKIKLISKPIVTPDDEIDQKDEKLPPVSLNPGNTALPTDSTLKKEELQLDSLALKVKPTRDSLANKLKPALDSLAILAKPKMDSLANKSKPALETIVSKASLLPDTIKPKSSALDTIKTRVIRAYQGTKIYKSNLQAKADSLFFAAADSTLRLYKEPIIWSDSTQLFGDTIHVQIRAKKIDNALLFQNSFIASQQADTAKFNQIKGMVITAFFEQGEIQTMYVDGNSESVIYQKNEQQEYSSNQTVSARIRANFKNKELHEVDAIKVMMGDYTPSGPNVKNIILTSFIWKPELRPKNKIEITGIRKPAKLPVKPTSKIPAKAPTKAPAKIPAKTSTKTSTKTPLKATANSAPGKTNTKATTKAPAKAPVKKP